jgi:hypothetical protein
MVKSSLKPYFFILEFLHSGHGKTNWTNTLNNRIPIKLARVPIKPTLTSISQHLKALVRAQ